MNTLTEYRYLIHILDASQEPVAICDDALSVSYKAEVNAPGLCAITVPEDHQILDLISLDTIIVVYISYPALSPVAKNAGQGYEVDFVGVYRDREISTDQNGNVYHTLLIPGLNEVLSRYVVAYFSGVTDKTQWVATELSEIIDDVVVANCTASATTGSGRFRDATVIHGLTTGGTVAGTDAVDFGVSPGTNVLDLLRELAPLAGVDFSVSLNSGDIIFQQHDGQLGTDRSDSIIFDLALDNVVGSGYTLDRLREKTVAIVGGQGEASSRIFAVRFGANYAADNDKEFFINASDKEEDELTAIADAELVNYAARVQLQGSIAASLGYVYRRDFELGDLVKMSFAGFEETKKIDSVQVVFDQGQRMTIQFELVAP